MKKAGLPDAPLPVGTDAMAFYGFFRQILVMILCCQLTKIDYHLIIKHP
jgi:hypothetical protein